MKPKNNFIKTTYLNKSIKLYKISGGLLIFSICAAVILKPLLANFAALVDLIISLPILLFFFLPPLGLYYSWKSYTLKEEPTSLRLRYLLGHSFFCLLIVFFISIIFNDLKQLFQ